MVKKKRFKRLAWFMSIIMMLSVLMPTASQVAKAAGVDWSEATPTGYYYGESGAIDILHVNGQVAFCVEPGKSVTTVEGYTETSPKFSTAHWNELVYIANAGYNSSKNTKADFAATQAYMWQVIRSWDGHGISLDLSTNIPGFKSKVSAIKSEVTTLKNLQRKNPSFSGGTYTVTVGTPITITDSNSLLSRYTVSSKSKGISASKSGNKLTISATENAPDNAVVKLTYSPKNLIKSNNYFYHPSSQDVANVGYLSPKTITVNLKVNKYGSLELKKSSANTDMTNGNSCYSLEGAVYGVYNASTDARVDTMTTDENGEARIDKILAGSYYVKEITAPKGYAIDTKAHNITIRSNQTTELKVSDNPQNDPAGVLLQKFDSETGESIPQGDGSLAGAEYTVKYYNDLYDSLEELDGVEPTRTWVYKTDSNGYINLRFSTPIPEKSDELYYDSNNRPAFPLGTVTIQETKAPEGYFVNDEIYLEKITSVGSAELVNTYNKPTDDTAQSEKVKKMKVHIFKAGTEESGQMPGLEGAEFTMKLESDVQAAYDAGYTYAEVWKGIDENGNPQSGISSARIAAAQAIAPDMAVVTTDANGDAYTEGLPYGTYLGKETKTPKNYESAGDFKFTVSKDESEVTVENKYINIYLNDKPMKAQVKMVKKDADSDKVVSLNSATFKIVALEDIYDRSTGELMFAKGDTIKQKVAGQWHSEFTTNSKNEVGTFAGEDGTIFTPLPLEPGKYQVEEIKTPEGFLNLEEPVKFEIDNIRDYTQDEDGEYMIEVVVKNEQPKGKITLEKTIEEIEDADFALIDKNADMSGIKFGLYAAEDIIDMADGEVKYDKGDLVGEYNLSKDGKLTIEGLWVGDYQLKELETLDGLVLDDTVYDISITKTDNTTKVISVAKEVVNKTTRTEITKTDVTGDKELPGAKLTLTDKETGKEVVTWTSTDEPYVIAGLVEGKTYVLTEVVAPDGYVLSASSVEFTVKEDGTTTTASMKDKYVDIVKLDLDENILYGAKFEVTDENNKVVDSWEVTKEDPQHKIRNLVEGKTYTLTETYAPDGYVMAAPVEIKVTEDKKNQTYTVIDKQVEFAKTDVDDNLVAGMEYEVKDVATDKVVDEGVTNDENPVLLNGLTVGHTYELIETKEPENFVKKAEPLTFTVTDEMEVQKISMFDKYVEVVKNDVNGKAVEGAEFTVFDKDGEVVDSWTTGTEPHKVTGLTEGETYTLEEVYAPEGYVKARPVTIEVTKDKENQTYTVTNKQVEFIKTDVDGNQLTGMEYIVTHDKTKQIVDRGVTNAKMRTFLNNLMVGETYTLEEIAEPYGYAKKAEPITFTVTADNEIQTVSLDNKYVQVEKVDENGNTVYGAEFSVFDKDGEVVDAWTVTEEDPHHKIVGLTEGETYTLEEVYAPEGYVKALPVTIEVSKDSVNQVYTVVNKQVEFKKVDMDGNALTGMEYVVTNDRTKEIVDRGVTNAKMTTYLNNLAVGETYTIYEKATPHGYATKAEPLTFTVTEDNELQVVTLENKYVEVIKEDPAGNIVYGAELAVLDKETGEAVDNWTVTKEDPAHKIVGLTEGKTYILTEQYAPDGYVIATDIEFTVNDNENQTIKMVDKQVAFAKVDTDGKLIAGMEYTVTSDKTKQIVDKGITNADEVVYLNGLVAGQTYTLTETGTPDGFATAVPITFTVGDDDRLQTVTLANKTVTFVKDNNKGDTLNGGKFALYDNEGNEMYQFTAKEEGVVLTGLSENESYSVKELEAPKGHDLNSKAVNFTVSTNTDDPTDKEDQIVTMTDRVTVTKTSDDMPLGLMLIALMLSAGGLTALGIRRRENH